MNNKSLRFENFDVSLVSLYRKSMPSFFEYNCDINKNAYLNWRSGFLYSQRNQFTEIGEAYFDTSYNLLLQCLDDNNDKKADLWIFPIMFNIVHGIEVYLKAINVSCNITLGKEDAKIEGNHNIKQLCEKALRLLEEYKNRFNNQESINMFSSIRVIKNYIDNIYEKTDDMTFARYPVDKKKNSHFYLNTHDNVVINMEILKEQTILIYHLLHYIYEMLEMHIDSNNDCY